MSELSKFFSYALRHGSADLGLLIDKEGWMNVADLIAKANSQGYDCDQEDVLKMVETNAKKRFELCDSQIRAVQGHTNVLVDRTFERLVPPDVLYHGTAARFMESIMAQGLSKMARQYVHLSPNTRVASEVGRRYGSLQLLEIDTRQMHQDGFIFYKAENGVWLVEAVPVKYIGVL